MKQNRLVLAALLSAICAATGFLFMSIPNFEFFMGMIFISGFLLGPRWGAIIGIVATLIYSGLNPYGMAAPPLLAAQLFCYGLTGVCGGMAAFFKLHERRFWMLAIFTALFGLLLTVIYDVLTTLSFAVFISNSSWKQIVAVFVSGAVFYLIHVLVNTASFAIIVPVLMNRLDKIRVTYE